jgi:kinetochore protein Mis13/DSN1
LVNSLEEEKSAWEALASSSTLMPPPPPPPAISAPIPTLSEIDASLLDPEQAAILSALQTRSRPDEQMDTDSSPQHGPSPFTFTTPSALQSHLTHLSASLEPNIDLLADGLHKIEQYRSTAERVADRVLGTASQRLEERERESKEKAGTEGIGVGDVLRGLAGVLNE